MLTANRRHYVRMVLRGELSDRKAAKILRITRTKLVQLIIEYARELDANGAIVF